MNKPVFSYLFLVAFILAMLLLVPYANATENPEQKNKEKTTTSSEPDKDILTEMHMYFHDGRDILDQKDKLRLSEEQIEKIENLMLEHESYSIRNSGEIKIKEMQFASRIESSKQPPDRKTVETFIRDISSLKTEMFIHYANYLLDLREILSQKQLNILKQTH